MRPHHRSAKPGGVLTRVLTVVLVILRRARLCLARAHLQTVSCRLARALRQQRRFRASPRPALLKLAFDLGDDQQLRADLLSDWSI